MGKVNLEETQSDGFCFLHEGTSLVFIELLREWNNWDRELMVVMLRADIRGNM